jgi:hypothetical protein
MPFVHNQTYPANYSTFTPAAAWGSAAYGNGTFVLTPQTADVTAYSTNNGQTWNSGSTLTIGVNKVAYGNGKFVAVGTGTPSKIAYSSDGVTWTNSTSFTYDYNWTGVAYGNGIWVAVCETKTGNQATTTFATSTNGTTWEMRNTLPVNSRWATVVYGPSGFLAVSRTTAPTLATVLRSTNGINWTSLGQGPTYTIVDSVYGNGYYVCLNSGRRLSYSTDGVTWTTNTNISPVSNTPGLTDSIAYGNGLFVVSGYSGAANPPNGNNLLFSSTLSGTWNITNIPSQNTYGWPGLAYGTAPTAGWICAGFFYTPSNVLQSTSATSADGQNWF